MSPQRWICLRFTIFLWICVTQLVQTQNVNHKDAEFDVTYSDSVTSRSQIIYKFSRTIDRNTKQAVLSFQVPLMLRGVAQNEYPFYRIGRTLCHPPIKSASETQTQSFFVDVSTLSGQRTNYELQVSRLQSFTLQTDQKLNFAVSPSQPQYFKYVFPEGVDTVIVKVRSKMKFPCSVMSIQDIQCPVYDLEQNVDFIGKYQTITKLGAITVQRKDFGSNSFYVAVVVKIEDEACDHFPSNPEKISDAEKRTKILDLVVSPVVDKLVLYQDERRDSSRMRGERL
ncbi:hypothetical protein WMY93_000459 [Mugilogobius chulae]|uniref:SID1 transmembrane family member 2 n=1 Tax=Mugilogobius chulae TaxID=88201 RepID=A0AAW0PZ02_9GOBI